MEPNQNNQKPKVNARDLFLNLGAVVALYTTIISLINLLFTIINKAYPKVTDYYYYGSTSISWPVAVLVIFFPILILLMWLLEKSYMVEPERQRTGIHRWISYITLFLAGLLLAGDLIVVLYYFIDGQELTTGFLLKVLVLLVISGGLFGYYISDIRGKLTSNSRKVWRVVSAAIIIGSIIWGFAVLGSPRTQRLYKYDEQKVSDLQMINSWVQDYFRVKGSLPTKLSDLTAVQYVDMPVDEQSGQSYEYVLVGQSAKAYKLCAEFNKDAQNQSVARVYYPNGVNWTHPSGHYCFDLSIPLDMYPPIKV